TDLSSRIDQVIGVVTGVSDELLAVSIFEEVSSHRGVVALVWSQLDMQRLPRHGYYCVDLRRKASSRATQSVSLDPPFPPAASKCARMIDAPTMDPSSSSASILIASAANRRSQVPRFAQLVKRLYTPF